ncbi:hypothetical protein BS50DRAFT_571664 [Corynespora cassiicola Philippines]|uniref:Uncharacterized protein n=1 Tax=Corynespora cassiicola Philippines TaxID=1448308 RepID=A0A2T2NYS9_CORCC|nr:hypothetical protein BS50DRAFT_571664 [Corynespora cassiicola Philippines]
MLVPCPPVCPDKLCLLPTVLHYTLKASFSRSHPSAMSQSQSQSQSQPQAQAQSPSPSSPATKPALPATTPASPKTTSSPAQSNAKKPQASGNRASTRMSTYSATPTLTPSIAPSHLSDASMANDPKAQEIKSWNAGFERLEDKRLVQQRYLLSSEKTDDMSKLALGAKLERALGRRMSGQDAVLRPKVISEKKVQA